MHQSPSSKTINTDIAAYMCNAVEAFTELKCAMDAARFNMRMGEEPKLLLNTQQMKKIVRKLASELQMLEHCIKHKD